MYLIYHFFNLSRIFFTVSLLLWRDPASLLLRFQILVTFFEGISWKYTNWHHTSLSPNKRVLWLSPQLRHGSLLTLSVCTKISEKNQKTSILNSCLAQLDGPSVLSLTSPKSECGLTPAASPQLIASLISHQKYGNQCCVHAWDLPRKKIKLSVQRIFSDTEDKHWGVQRNGVW